MTSSRTRRRSASSGLTVLLGITFVLVSAARLDAQAVTDPRVAEFDPSPDHWAVLDNGHPAVLRYELGVYVLGASAPLSTVDMGKPSPDADGKIRYDFAGAVAGWSLPGGEYEARVSAVGPEGVALSDPSNPFTFTTNPTCGFSLNATTVSAAASSGNYAVEVSTGAGCEWAVTTALPWVTLWTGGGSGSGTAAFAVQANPSSSSRTGTIDVAGQTLTVSQDGAAQPCSYSVSPASATVSAAGGSGEVRVTTDAGCAWTVVSSQTWLVPAVRSGTGAATFTFNAAPNSGTKTRQAKLTVGPWAVSVTQSGKPRRRK